MNTGNCNGKRRSTSVALAAAFASAVAVLGGGPSLAKPIAAKKQEVKKVDTAEIKKSLEEKLSRDARFSNVTSVKVDPASGIVTLSGRVRTEADRDAVGKLASSVKGVAMIYNEIQPEKPGP